MAADDKVMTGSVMKGVGGSCRPGKALSNTWEMKKKPTSSIIAAFVGHDIFH